MRSIAISVALLLAACNKTPPPAPPAPEAPREAEHLPPPTAQPAPSAAAEAAAPLPSSEGFSVNEPMPPVDEEGAPPTITARGTCAGADAEHAVSGEVTIYDAGSGSRLLRIENLHAPSGATDLGLAASAKPGAGDVGSMAALGALKGASGNMNYLVERKLELAPPRALLLAAHETRALIGYCVLTPPGKS